MVEALERWIDDHDPLAGKGESRGCFGLPHFRSLPYRTGHVISSGAVRRWPFPRQEGRPGKVRPAGLRRPGRRAQRQGVQAGALPAHPRRPQHEPAHPRLGRPVRELPPAPRGRLESASQVATSKLDSERGLPGFSCHQRMVVNNDANTPPEPDPGAGRAPFGPGSTGRHRMDRKPGSTVSVTASSGGRGVRPRREGAAPTAEAAAKPSGAGRPCPSGRAPRRRTRSSR